VHDHERGTPGFGPVEAARTEPRQQPATSPVGGAESLATCLYVNLAMPEHAAQAAALPVDGVGLLRAEFMLTEALEGTHPGISWLARAARDSAPR
jgi:pyruvate,water dikinase